jgi:metallophosphoesterase ykuE
MSPSQGLFPKYTSGVKYSKNHKTGVIISRGIGNTTVPYRMFNPSEIIYFKLKVEK